MRVLAAVLGLAILAGCTGANEDANPIPEAIAELAGPSEEELARTPGVLEGVVHTEALAPIVGANVTDARLGLSALTDAAGFFRLPGLVTGEHLLTVSAANYATRSMIVNAKNGTTVEVNISLAFAPPSEPFVETRELQGFLSCAALVNGEARDCASADPNHRDIFEFELAPDGKMVVLELEWDASSTPTAPEMTLSVETVGYGAQDIELGNATGSGHARILVPQGVMEKFYPEGGLMRATVTLAQGDAPAALAVQSEFVVYVTTFYHKAGPGDFSLA